MASQCANPGLLLNLETVCTAKQMSSPYCLMIRHILHDRNFFSCWWGLCKGELDTWVHKCRDWFQIFKGIVSEDGVDVGSLGQKELVFFMDVSNLNPQNPVKVTHVSNLELRNFHFEPHNQCYGISHNTAITHMHQHNYQNLCLTPSIKDHLIPFTPWKPQLQQQEKQFCFEVSLSCFRCL